MSDTPDRSDLDSGYNGTQSLSEDDRKQQGVADGPAKERARKNIRKIKNMYKSIAALSQAGADAADAADAREPQSSPSSSSTTSSSSTSSSSSLSPNSHSVHEPLVIEREKSTRSTRSRDVASIRRRRRRASDEPDDSQSNSSLVQREKKSQEGGNRVVGKEEEKVEPKVTEGNKNLGEDNPKVKESEPTGWVQIPIFKTVFSAIHVLVSPLLDEGGATRAYWRSWMVLVVMYNFIMVPLYMSILEPSSHWSLMTLFAADVSYFLDTYLCIYDMYVVEGNEADIIEQMREALREKKEKRDSAKLNEIKDPKPQGGGSDPSQPKKPMNDPTSGVAQQRMFVKEARQHALHMKSRLQLMFVIMSTVPIPLLTGFLLASGWPDAAGLVEELRLVRLLRFPQMISFMHHWEAENLRQKYIDPVVVKMVKLALSMYVTAHVAGCMYYFISMAQGFPEDNLWVVPQHIVKQPSLILTYTHIIYWAFSVMTGIGAGLEEPQTVAEHVFTVLVVLVGVTMYATLVGSLGHIIQSTAAKTETYINKMEAVNSFSERNELPGPLKERLQNCFEYLHYQDQLDDKWDALADCPRYLRNEVTYELYAPIVRKVRLFKFCEEGFIRSLCILLKPQVCLPGDWLIREGEVGKEMYLVVRGALDIIAKDMVVATIQGGSYVGEVAVLYEQKRIASVRAVMYCDLLMLTKSDIDSVVDHYPKVLEQMGTEAKLYPSIQKMLKERHERLKNQTHTSPRRHRPSPVDARKMRSPLFSASQPENSSPSGSPRTPTSCAKKPHSPRRAASMAPLGATSPKNLLSEPKSTAAKNKMSPYSSPRLRLVLQGIDEEDHEEDEYDDGESGKVNSKPPMNKLHSVPTDMPSHPHVSPRAHERKLARATGPLISVSGGTVSPHASPRAGGLSPLSPSATPNDSPRNAPPAFPLFRRTSSIRHRRQSVFDQEEEPEPVVVAHLDVSDFDHSDNGGDPL